MPIQYESAKALVSRDQPFAYTDRETMLYALGIGLGADPMNRAELPFVYEQGLRTVPTQATVAAWGAWSAQTLGSRLNTTASVAPQRFRLAIRIFVNIFVAKA